MDEFEELKPQSKVVEMERWNIEDLETYIKSLNDEIIKVNQIKEPYKIYPKQNIFLPFLKTS